MYVNRFSLELLPRVELGTSSLPRMRSTTELKQQRLFFFGAEDGAQTRDPQLGRLVLYRLSYFRIFLFGRDATCRSSTLWVVMDSNHRRRKPADLQSAPFGHSGNHPLNIEPGFHPCPSSRLTFEPLVGFEPTTPRLQITCSGQLS